MAQPMPWENDAIVSQSNGPLPSPPKPQNEPKDPLEQRYKTLQIQKMQQDIATQQAKSATQQAGGDAVSKLTGVIDQIDKVAIDSADNNGLFETGATGSMMRSFGPAGTAAYDLDASIKKIDANAAFDALQKMREASPTGGALGSITEKELELLRSTVANLDPNQSQPAFLAALADAKKTYLDRLRAIDPAAADMYAQRKGIRWNDRGEAILYSMDGQDNRAEQDPMGIRSGNQPPPPGGPGGPSGGLDPRSYDPTGLSGLGDLAVQGMSAGLSDEASGIGGAISSLMLGQDPVAGYRRDRDAARLNLEQARKAWPIMGTAAELLGGGGGARVAGGSNALGGALRQGAGLGGLAGFGYGEGNGSVPNALLGAVGGAALGGALHGVNALASRRAPGAASELSQAATRQGVDLLPADAGGPVARAITTGAKASPLSVSPIVKAAERQQGQMAQATRRVADGQGAVADTDIVGQGVRNAAERFTKDTAARGSRLYSRAGEAAKGVRIKPVQTLDSINAYIARVKNNPAAGDGAVAELEKFRDNIAGGVNVEGLRDARTTLSNGVYDGKLRSGSEQAMWKDILGNLSSDIENGLASVGKQDAAQMFRRADAFWKDRVEHIDQVLQPILGKGRGGEEVLAAVERMTRGQGGGNARLSRLLANMTPEEAGQLRGTIINRLGRANPGAQDADGAAYSAATFLTNWNKMTPQAKASLFADGKLRADLSDIAKLAEGMKVSQQMANHSNTGIAVASNIGAQAALATQHPVAMALGAGAQYLTGRLMASPGFARALARSAKMPPNAATKSLRSVLATIAANDNAVAGDANALGAFLSNQLSKSPGQAAAQDPGDSRRVPPQQ